MDDSLRFCGQILETQQRALIVELATRYGRLSRHELAQTVCELLDWHRPNGQPKTIECRALLERMQEAGLIDLATLRPGRPRGAVTSVLVSPDPEPAVTDAPLATLQPIRLQRVATPAQRTLWRTLIERHHPLGHRVPFGAQVRYLIQATSPSPAVLGCLQFSSPAWRLQGRDQWIGWDEATRARHLQSVLCNSRFLILPPVRVKNLASHVLALALRTVISDWTAAYGVQPLLAETLVDPARFTGHCYRAANWIDVGLTAGRGREDRQHLRHGVSPKRILLYPLVPNARQRLLQAP
ncbi:MAG: Druantia anti-phage system protein DruA [Acidobacteriaceae bacterium]